MKLFLLIPTNRDHDFWGRRFCINFFGDESSLHRLLFIYLFRKSRFHLQLRCVQTHPSPSFTKRAETTRFYLCIAYWSWNAHVNLCISVFIDWFLKRQFQFKIKRQAFRLITNFVWWFLQFVNCIANIFIIPLRCLFQMLSSSYSRRVIWHGCTSGKVQAKDAPLK